MKVLLEFNQNETSILNKAVKSLDMSAAEFIKACLYKIDKIFIGEPATAKEHIDFLGTIKSYTDKPNG